MAEKVVLTGKDEDGTEVGNLFGDESFLFKMGKTASEPTIWPPSCVLQFGDQKFQVHTATVHDVPVVK